MNVMQRYRPHSMKLMKGDRITHLVLDARLEVPKKGVGFVVLDLPELHRPAPQEVIQLCGEDGCCSALILRTFVTSRRQRFLISGF